MLTLYFNCLLLLLLLLLFFLKRRTYFQIKNILIYFPDTKLKADLHGMILSHATSLRRAYDTFQATIIAKFKTCFEIHNFFGVVSVS